MVKKKVKPHKKAKPIMSKQNSHEEKPVAKEEVKAEKAKPQPEVSAGNIKAGIIIS